LCRSETDCQSRIHCLLEAVYFTFNFTRPSPVTTYLLQVKSESLIICNTQNSVLYADHWVTKCPISFIGRNAPSFVGHKAPSFVGHKVPYFVGRKETCLFVTKWPVGHKVANALALSLPHYGHKVAHSFGVDIHKYIAR